MADRKPREPEDHAYTGTGTTRSADDGLPQEGAFSVGDVDPAVAGGARGRAHPAQADDVTINRSGSGGSGGPVDAAEDVEGSTGASMSELLSGEDDERPPTA